MTSSQRQDFALNKKSKNEIDKKKKSKRWKRGPRPARSLIRSEWVVRWMSGEMNEWWDEWMVRWMNGEMNEWWDEWMVRWMNGKMNEWWDEWGDWMMRWMNGTRDDKWWGEWMKRRMNEEANEEVNEWRGESIKRWMNGEVNEWSILNECRKTQWVTCMKDGSKAPTITKFYM